MMGKDRRGVMPGCAWVVILVCVIPSVCAVEGRWTSVLMCDQSVYGGLQASPKFV